ncbi:MAG: hypothetical protein ACREL3_02600 [Gemmatimonadales bacterium]
MRIPIVWALLALVLTGCGGGDATGPSNASVAGTWTMSLSNLSGSGVSCNLSATPVTIAQSGTTFSGTYGPGTLSCFAGSQSNSVQIQGTIVNGTVDGNAVVFDLDTQDFHQTGSVAGNSMSGTARWTIDLGGSSGIVVLNGNWSAAKQ